MTTLFYGQLTLIHALDTIQSQEKLIHFEFGISGFDSLQENPRFGGLVDEQVCIVGPVCMKRVQDPPCTLHTLQQCTRTWVFEKGARSTWVRSPN